MVVVTVSPVPAPVLSKAATTAALGGLPVSYGPALGIMATLLWDQLRLDEFWFAALPPSREGTNWLNILKTLVGYQLISPGSEWRLHRHWFEHSAMGDLLGEDLALVQPNNLYRCLDKLTAHNQAMFSFLGECWKDLFQADFEVQGLCAAGHPHADEGSAGH